MIVESIFINDRLWREIQEKFIVVSETGERHGLLGRVEATHGLIVSFIWFVCVLKEANCLLRAITRDLALIE